MESNSPDKKKIENIPYSARENQRFAKFIFENDEEYNTMAAFCREAANAVQTKDDTQLRSRYTRLLESVNIYDHNNKTLLTPDEKMKVANEYILDTKWMADRGYIENVDETYSKGTVIEKKATRVSHGESSSTVHDAEEEHKQSIKDSMEDNGFEQNDGKYELEKRSSEQAEKEKKDREASRGESSSTVHDAEEDHKQSIKKEDLESDSTIDRIEKLLIDIKNLMIEEKSHRPVSEDRVREMIEERLQAKK